VNSGLYTAYSGLRARSDALDILANNLANLNTTGFKEEKAFFTLLDQSLNAPGPPETIGTAINRSVLAHKALNPAEGSLSFTNRDLDVAVVGNGFLVVETPQGIRYTRNGNLQLNAQAILTTSEGFPILGQSGHPIQLGPGKIHISEDGQISVEGTPLNQPKKEEDVAPNKGPVDSLKIVAFDDLSVLEREGSSLFRSRDGRQSEKSSTAALRSGYLEESNVNPISSIVQMVEILRHFEAIQKSVNLLMNDINSKAIEKLGR